MALLVRPVTITATELTSSNASEAVSAYSATTQYATGDQVYDATTMRIYEAVAGGTTHTFAAGDVDTGNDVITWTAHGIADDTPIVFRGSSLPSPLTAGTTYYKRPGLSADNFKVSTTSGGSAVNLTTTGSGTMTFQLTTENYGRAVTNVSYWLDIGPMNKWAMFDTYNTTQTSRASNIEVQIAPGTRVDTVALLNLSGASSVRIQANNGSTYYDQTFSLTETAFADDWYAGTYSETHYKNRFAVSNITPNSGTTLTITISGSGTVYCGSCIVGLSKEIGGAEYGAEVGIDDYSLIERDDYGTLTITQRDYNDRGDFSLFVPKEKNAAILSLITSYRATPALWLMVPDDTVVGDWDGPGIIYGIPTSFKSLIREPSHVWYNLELTGLT
jgi:hypothetical protein